jgi:hypothetical protein
MKHLLVIIFLLMSFGAFAQSDTTVTNTFQLDGTNSNDKDNLNGGIIKYEWVQISGPASTIINANTSKATVTLPVYGVRVYQLTVTNNAGLTDTQQMQVTQLPGDHYPHAVILAVPILKQPPQK